jgi:ABC-type sugar transport system ATPase subunit
VKTGKLDFKIAPVKACPSERVILAIRPEKTEVFRLGEAPGGAEPSNLIPGKIEVVTFLGAAVRLVVRMGDEEVISDVIEKEFEQRQLKQGEEIFLYFPTESFLVYPAEEGHG